MADKIKEVMYLHGCKDSNAQMADKIGLKYEAWKVFRHALCEVKFEVEVDKETGEVEIISVDGRKLEARMDSPIVKFCKEEIEKASGVNRELLGRMNTRTETATGMVDSMSATDIRNGRECQWKVFHKLTTIEKPPKSVPLLIGIVFHSVIESNLRYRVMSGKAEPWDRVVAIFEAQWKKQARGIVFDKMSQGAAMNKCLKFIQTYVQQVCPMLYPLSLEYVEKFFSLKINWQGQTLAFNGKIDLVSKDMWVTDHKTSSSDWSQDEADKEIQAQLYPYCMKMQGLGVKGFKFSVVTKSGIEVYDVAYNEVKVAKILEEAFDLKRCLEEGNLLRAKSARACGWCEWKGKCEEKIE